MSGLFTDCNDGDDGDCDDGVGGHLRCHGLFVCFFPTARDHRLHSRFFFSLF